MTHHERHGIQGGGEQCAVAVLGFLVEGQAAQGQQTHPLVQRRPVQLAARPCIGLVSGGILPLPFVGRETGQVSAAAGIAIWGGGVGGEGFCDALVFNTKPLGRGGGWGKRFCGALM